MLKRKRRETVVLVAIFVFITMMCVNVNDIRIERIHSRSQESSSLMTISWNDTGPSHALWPGDDQCSQFVTRFAAQHSLPTRALVSYPGSGNTWLRVLIEAATGVFTGSIYEDEDIIDRGHLGEQVDFRDGTTILQKAHAVYPMNISKLFGGKGVLLIRNPYKALISSWNYASTHSHIRSTNTEVGSKQFVAWARNEIMAWLKIITDWVDNSVDLHYIFYENVKENPMKELRVLLKYLNVSIDESRLACIRKHDSEEFHRPQTDIDMMKSFPKELIELINRTIIEADKLIFSKLGRHLPLDKYDGFVTKENLKSQVITFAEDGQLGNLLLETATLLLIGEIIQKPVHILPNVYSQLQQVFSPFPYNVLEQSQVTNYKWKKVPAVEFMKSPQKYKDEKYIMLQHIGYNNLLGNLDRVKKFFRPFLKQNVINVVEDYFKLLEKEAERKLSFVSIHVRRTDFNELMSNHIHGSQVDKRFFFHCIEAFLSEEPNSIFLVTSDDIEWCKEHLQHDKVIFPQLHTEEGPMVTDFILATQANHSIYDYGSFGFWGAVLAGGKTMLADGYSDQMLLLKAIKDSTPRGWQTVDIRSLK